MTHNKLYIQSYEVATEKMYLFFVVVTNNLQDGTALSIDIKMLLAWKSNYMHDKESVYSSDLELLLQLHKVHNLYKTSTEFTATTRLHSIYSRCN